MNADTIGVLNFVVHSLVIGAAAWLLVRFVIRDALRRCILANLAVLMCLYTPFDIRVQDLLPKNKEAVPVWTPIKETFKADWRVSVAPASVPKVEVAAERRSWDVDDVVRGMRWLAWVVTAGMLLRLMVQSVRVQRWAWGLRRLSSGERELVCGSASEFCGDAGKLESSRGLEQSRTLARVRVFEGASTPCVAGWFFPVIAVPVSAFGKLTPRQWRWLLRHEGEHLRLHDTVAALLQNMVRALLWWNPFVHALVEEYARAREEACDAAAVGEEREHTAYADFLLACAAGATPQRACVMPIAQSRPARRLKARLVALMEAQGVRKKVGALFVLGCLAFAVIAPVIAASFGIATAAAQEPVKIKADDGTLYTREYKVAPDFLSGGVTLTDPFAPGKAAAAAVSRKTARELLREKGVAFPPGASAIYNPTTSQLIVRNTKANLEMVERGIDALNQRPMMVYFTCKLIQADRFFGTHESILSPADAETLIRSVSQKKGIDLLTSPSATTRFDQNAGIFAGREVLPKLLPNGKLSGGRKFVGVSIELIAKSPAQGKSIIETEASLGVDPDSDAPWFPKGINSADWDKVSIHSVAAKAALASSETLLLHLPTSKRPVTVLITAAALNPSGGNAESFSATMRVAPPASQGRDVPEEKATDKESTEMSERVYRLPDEFPRNQPPVEVLKAAGINFPKTADALLKDGKLTVRNTKANLELIEAWIASLIDVTKNKSIRVTVQAVEMKGDFLKLSSGWLPPLPVDPKIAKTLDPALAEPQPLPAFIRQLFTSAGIFAPDQFKTVIKRIGDSKAKIETLKPKGELQTYKLPATMGGFEVKVESRIGMDGNTIDLTATLDDLVNKRSSTGVCIWGGQTFVLAAQPSEDVSWFLFITGEIEDKAGKK
jgi:beta-lactamase regulating signal transducer with metallopeptidase domain